MDTEDIYTSMVALLDEMQDHIQSMEIAAMAGEPDRVAIDGLRALVVEGFEVVERLHAGGYE